MVSNAYQECHFLITHSVNTELRPRMTAFTRLACATWLGRSQLAILGGRDGTNGLKNIHIYDLAKETWTVGKDLHAKRYTAACTTLTLKNGTRIVVVIGGKSTYYAIGETFLIDWLVKLYVLNFDGYEAATVWSQ